MKKELSKESIRVILQMPQGLQMFACALSDIFEHFTQSEVGQFSPLNLILYPTKEL